eukprot:TRINITY_DN96_c4_g1_i1.p1 TRINITY_DN96_c4_g1~~TRINITY_DN96_c4_g1_i1.p1  ORF type:complete len:1190 (+),score=209.66 TRINITY_DN96_c4_g1_i1:7480-11049(+)
MISSYGITPQFIFGVRADVKEALHFWDEKKLVYVAGHNVVDYNLEENQQKFYSPMEGSVAITALTMSPQRALMAFSETQKAKGPIIHIYDKTQRKRRSLIPTTVQANSVVCMAFASTKEERNILVLYGPPEYALIYWRWDSSTCEATLALNTPIESAKCSFCPGDPGICVLTGHKTFMFIKIESKGEGKGDSLVFNVACDKIKANDDTEPAHSHEYTSHCWTNEAYLIVGTDQGELLALDPSGYFIGMIKLPGKVDCLIPYSRGFIAACGGPSIYAIEFVKEDAENPMQILEKYAVGEPEESIKSLAIKPNVEGAITCITSGKQLIKIDMASKKSQELISEFHSKGVIGLDVCVRKPLVVTCSEDNTIRLWNYVEKRQELKFKSPEINPQSVAFHPSGLHIVIGCTDKVHIMNVFLKNLKVSQEITVKQFREVSFSRGGHYLAVSHTNVLQVYNFYTMEIIPSLTVSPAKIQAVEWYEDDTGFVTSDQSNYVSFCGLDAQPVNMHVSNKVTVSSVLKVPESSVAFAACSDHTIKEVTGGAVNKKLEITANPSQIAMTRNQKLFFVGIGESKMPGAVKYYKFPLSAGECTDIQAHSEEIKRMKISRDDKYLFTVGKDGCVIVYEIKEREKTRENKELGLLYSDEILTDKQEVNDIQQRLEDAKNKNKELTNQKGIAQDSELARLKRKIEEVNREIHQKKADYVDSYARKQNALATLKSEQEDKRKKQIQNNLKELDKMKRKNLEDQSQRATEYSKKNFERENLLQAQQDERERLIKNYDQEIKNMQAQYQQELEKTKAEVEQKRKERDSKKDNQTKIIEQINEDNEREMEMMKSEHNKQLQKKNEQVVKLRGENQVNLNKIEECSRKEVELKRDINEMEDAFNKATEEERKLRKEKENLTNILSEKSEAIKQLEQKIYQHKKEAQKLEKFKFVLDYKIKELKREMNPREKQIEGLREKTTEMDKKLKKFNKLNVFLGYRLKELQDTQKALQQEITDNREKLRKNAISRKEQLDALDYCVQFIHSPEKLKQSIIEKLEKYKKEGEQATKLPSTISHEFKNQEEFMANSVKTLERELEASKKIRKDSNKLIRNQNKVLILEIQDLRGRIAMTKGTSIVPGQKTFMRSTKMAPHMTMSKMRAPEENLMAPEEYAQQVEFNKETILKLKERIEELSKQNEEIKAMKRLPAQNEL